MTNRERATPPGTQGTQTRVESFEDIQTPGAWVSDNGCLFRVPSNALKEGHSPVVDVRSDEISGYTLISNDPYAPIGKLRQLAANSDLAVKF